MKNATDWKPTPSIESISEPLPNGEVPVAATLFHGMILAATANGVYRLSGREWERLEFTAGKGEEAVR